MQTNATYTYSSHAPLPAYITLQKHALQISLWTSEGERTVIWHYDQMAKDAKSDFDFAYATYPVQIIAVHSKELADQLTQRLQDNKKAYFSKRRSTILKVVTGFAVLLAVAYFFILPWVAAGFANRIPASYEKEMGDQIFNNMKSDFEIDASKTAYLNDFFQQLKVPSQYDIQITVVKSDIANAFAMPGGHIVVYDKIINNMASYPELAALLAHEFIHVENRHSLKSIFRQLSSTLFISMLMGDAGAVGDIIIGNANHLKSLSYSRSLEKEADENGLALLTQRHIDCNGFVRLFQLLKKETTAEESEWVSSHPNLNKRIKNIQQNALCQEQKAINDSTLQYLFLKLKTAD
jgi:beta-barrel assembly-enhancing protease